MSIQIRLTHGTAPCVSHDQLRDLLHRATAIENISTANMTIYRVTVNDLPLQVESYQDDLARWMLRIAAEGIEKDRKIRELWDRINSLDEDQP